MDFAQKQLEKYGWKPGEGLGKNKTGIATAIKPKLKCDKSGLGLDISEEFTYKWWEHSFNTAASRISVQSKEGQVNLKTKKNSSPLEITTKRPCAFVSEDEKHTLTYGKFKKTSRLISEGTEERLAPTEQQERQLPELVQHLSDEQLFQACGGRTAHKSARHGSGLSGKLARVQQQEQAELKRKKNICEDTMKTKKKKKNKK